MGVEQFSNQALVAIQNAVNTIQQATDQISGIATATAPKHSVATSIFSGTLNTSPIVLSVNGGGVLKWLWVAHTQAGHTSTGEIIIDGVSYVIVSAASLGANVKKWATPTGQSTTEGQCDLAFSTSLVVKMNNPSTVANAQLQCGYIV